MKTYTVKQLAAMIQPGQLGMQGDGDMLLFRPLDPHNPSVKALSEASNWYFVTKSTEVLQVYPTLENFNYLNTYRLGYTTTPKVESWLKRARGECPPDYDWSQATVLFDFQRDGAKFLAQCDRAMLSLSPGLGKTLTSAYAAGVRDFKKVLVVAPASLLYYWKGELEKWADHLPHQPFVYIWHRSKVKSMSTMEETSEDAILDMCAWVITNPESVTKSIDELKATFGDFDCLIVDETIMYKHRESQRSKAIKELAREMPVVWFLTGAPATRFLDDMWHQFHILKPKGYPSYWRFTNRYCLVDDNEWGSKVVANAPDAEEKIKKNFSDIYFSRTQDDVANIPDWIMEDVDIPMHPQQSEAYDILREQLYVRLESIDPSEVITVNNHLALMVRSVQVASNPLLLGGVDSAGKWDALPELMKVYPGPYIIWVNFIQTGNYIRDRMAHLKYRVALANGSTPMETRNEMVDAIQNDELDVIILNNQVGKFGFTLTKARTAFFVERMYDDSYFQCLHRNRRIGTLRSPIIVNMRSVTDNGRQTIDHLIHSTLDYRVGMIKKITAGDLKKAFAK